MNNDAILHTIAKQRGLSKKYNKIIAYDLSNICYKHAIDARNRRLTEWFDVLLCRVINSYVAYQILQYVRKINKSIRKQE